MAKRREAMALEMGEGGNYLADALQQQVQQQVMQAQEPVVASVIAIESSPPIYVDTDGDGIPDHIGYDTTGDGVADTLGQQINPLAIEIQAQKMQQQQLQEQQQQQMQQQPPQLPEGWTESVAPDGRTYYINHITKVR